MNCWYKLNVDLTNALRKDFSFPKPSGLYGIWNPTAASVFNKEWLDYMKSVGLPIYNAMLFYRGPGASTKETHIDISKTNPLVLTNYGINWCIGGKGSNMIWYEKPGDGRIRDEDVSWTPAKTPYITWNYNEVTEVERTHIGNELTLVKTDLPHAILMKDDPRWCISARTTAMDNLEWDKIVELLRLKNLLVER